MSTNATELSLPLEDCRRLLASGSQEGALLYLSFQTGGSPENACASLRMSESTFRCALATLKQLGLYEERPRRVLPAEQRPSYTEADVTRALDRERDVRLLQGEVQRVLGRVLSTEELKIFLSFQHYLGLPAEVIQLLVNYCKERCRRRGNLRNPSIRMIEKEAYAWAEQGIDTMEAAAAFIREKNRQESQLGRLMRLLQISGRALTPAEERYALSWLSMGFDEEALTLAYNKTCLNTGGLKWPYMNKILQSWHQQKLHTGKEILEKDRKPGAPSEAPRALDNEEREAIARMLRQQEG